MITIVVIGFIAVACGVLLGGYLKISLAIRQEDKELAGSLRLDATSRRAQAARSVVGVSSGW